MSDEHIVQEKDKVESKTIVAVGVSALAIFALGIMWAIQIQRDAAGTIDSYTEQDRRERDSVAARVEVGMVYQQSFDKEFGARTLSLAHEQLDHVGWIDQKAKTVHIPIERAIKDYLAATERNGGKL